MLVKYHDENGQVKMSLLENSKWKREYSGSSCEHSSNSYDEHSSESHGSEISYEYSQRNGPNEDSDTIHDKYNISDEDHFENAEVYHEGHRHPYESESTEKLLKHFKHQHTSEYVDSNSESISHEKPRGHKQEQSHKSAKASKKSAKKSKKTVYIYKQPPIIVKPKPTNVYIKSKPILVQPPPLVVHHPAPKPCNPIIRYQPPNIKVKPVIVKISKPKKTTTTTTTPCPTTTTTKKPCRKCRRKPTKKCNRCSSRKISSPRFQRPKENKIYYEQYRPEQPQYEVLT